MSSWILDPYDQDKKMITLNIDISLNVAKLVKGKEEENMMYLFSEAFPCLIQNKLDLQTL
jgi:hypothetical protein